jgi:hypothetical protein
MSPAAKLAPLSATDLAGRAWGTLRDSIPTLWPLWIVCSVYGAGSAYWSRAVSPVAGHVSAAWLAYLAVNSIGGAILSGPAARVFLGGRKPWWTLDGALGRYVLIEGLGNLLIQSPYVIQFVGQTDASPAAAGAMLGVAVFQLVGVLLLAWIMVRLLLWPISQLSEDGALPPRRSWQLMRGAFWHYVGAAILAGLLPSIVAVSLISLYRANGAAWILIAQAPFNGVLGLIFTAVGVEVYRARVTEPDTLADVFD